MYLPPQGAFHFLSSLFLTEQVIYVSSENYLIVQLLIYYAIAKRKVKVTLSINNSALVLMQPFSCPLTRASCIFNALALC